VFLPHLAGLRRNEKLSNSAHSDGHRASYVCTEWRSCARLAHDPDLSGPCLRNEFGKRRGQYRLPFGDEKGTAEFITKVYHKSRPAMIDENIWGVFGQNGLAFVTIDEIQRVTFDEMKLRGNRHFEELWAIDFSLEDLPVRQGHAQFGWINRD
jgi:hypothetical protein